MLIPAVLQATPIAIVAVLTVEVAILVEAEGVVVCFPPLAISSIFIS